MSIRRASGGGCWARAKRSASAARALGEVERFGPLPPESASISASPPATDTLGGTRAASASASSEIRTTVAPSPGGPGLESFPLALSLTPCRPPAPSGCALAPPSMGRSAGLARTPGDSASTDDDTKQGSRRTHSTAASTRTAYPAHGAATIGTAGMVERRCEWAPTRRVGVSTSPADHRARARASPRPRTRHRHPSGFRAQCDSPSPRAA